MALVLIVLAGLVCGAVTTFLVLAVAAAARSMNDAEVWFGLEDDDEPAPLQRPEAGNWRRRRDLEAEDADQRDRQQLEADEATSTPTTDKPERGTP